MWFEYNRFRIGNLSEIIELPKKKVDNPAIYSYHEKKKY